MCTLYNHRWYNQLVKILGSKTQRAQACYICMSPNTPIPANKIKTAHLKVGVGRVRHILKKILLVDYLGYVVARVHALLVEKYRW